MVPTMGEIDHVAADPPLNVNIAAWPADNDAVEGVKEGVKETVLASDAAAVPTTAGISVITAVPLTPSCARLEAVSITVCGVATVAGAV
jgi:hypothetical protein